MQNRSALRLKPCALPRRHSRCRRPAAARAFLASSASIALPPPLLLLLPSVAVAASLRDSRNWNYEAFLERFGHRRLSPYAVVNKSSGANAEGGGAVPLSVRRALFERRVAEVEAHNNARFSVSSNGIFGGRRGASSSWVAAVNKFADLTDAERRGILGYRRVAAPRQSRGASASGAGGAGAGGQPVSFFQASAKRDAEQLGDRTVDWCSRAGISCNFVRDQGFCGSCWAIAAAGALETHAELSQGLTVPLSFQQLVDCVPNPSHCGGRGGCSGATAELALQYVMEHGLVEENGYLGPGVGAACEAGGGSIVLTSGFKKLPQNEVAPLLEVLASRGPVVVSVDASNWFSYHSGIFDGCSRDATVNHAVLAVGFGNDADLKKKFFLIRNSWGTEWGESGGYIRLERRDEDTGKEGHCGVDSDPQQGSGCDDGPKSTPVCGMCGVLSDSVYPMGVQVVKGHLAKGARRAEIVEQSFRNDAAFRGNRLL